MFCNTLNCNREPARACLARVDHELGRVVHVRRLQPGTHRTHFVRATCTPDARPLLTLTSEWHS